MKKSQIGMLLCGLVLAGCAKQPEGESAVGTREGAIINGQLEAGYPHIGALTIWYGNSYGGSFCTATLITPTWLITAAHCLEDGVEANQVRFYIGNDSRPVGNGHTAPNNGTFYRAASLHMHDRYNGRTLVNDIALVRLQTAVPANVATPMAYNTANLTPYQGQTAFYVGFGQTDGLDDYSSGVKYSTSFPISRVEATQFRSLYNGTGTCFGDSGGPAIININGVPSVVGVTSSGEACSGWNCDPCKTPSWSTRVDAYSPWIAQILGTSAPDCRQNSSLCGCAEACGSNGQCNNTLCQDLNCEKSYDCLVECESQSCVNGCYEQASPTAANQLESMIDCFDNRCGNTQTDAQFQQCAQQNCSAEINMCFGGASSTGNDTCDKVYDCLTRCTTNSCATACFEDGTGQAQQQIHSLLGCLEQSCANVSESQYPACARQYCGAQVDACFGAEEACDPVGRDCGAGQACYPTTDGSFACFPSAGKAAGAACNPNANSLECRDGLACVGDGSTGECVAFCRNASQCGGGTCDLSATGISGLGVCDAPAACVDADRDGVCAPEDCNDNDANVRPGAAEVCGNGKDDNCNGQVDEGCQSQGCVDNDQDGVCVEHDCDDNDPTIHPGGSERCGDNVDNNCDGQVDEGCGTCVDSDQDGYCESVDCNDQSAAINPTAAETCGDGIDNNCNGQVDESCGGTGGGAIDGSSSRPGCAGGGLTGFGALALVGLVAIRRRRS